MIENPLKKKRANFMRYNNEYMSKIQRNYLQLFACLT